MTEESGNYMKAINMIPLVTNEEINWCVCLDINHRFSVLMVVNIKELHHIEKDIEIGYIKPIYHSKHDW